MSRHIPREYDNRDARGRGDPRDARRDGRDNRDPRDPRDTLRDPRDMRDPRDIRDPRERIDPRDMRDARDIRDTRERIDPYARGMVIDDPMDMGQDRTRIGGRIDPPLQRGDMDPRGDPRDSRDPRDPRDPRMAMDSRVNRMEAPEPVMLREYRDARTGQIVREEIPPPPRQSFRDERPEMDNRRRPDYDTPMDDRGGPRFNDYFLPGEGINREVIQYEICRYLGQDATVRPTTHQDGRVGYKIRAYRALTSAMIATLQQDSARFEQEQRSGKHGRGGKVSYESSNTIDLRDRQNERDRLQDQVGYSGGMDIDDDYDRRRPVVPAPYGDDFNRRAQTGASRHQVPVTTAGYPPDPYAAGSYTIAPTTQGIPSYYDQSNSQPRIFSNTTPDPTGRPIQPGYGPSAGYPANTQAPRQPAVYTDPRTGQVVPGYPPSSGYTQESSRHAPTSRGGR